MCWFTVNVVHLRVKFKFVGKVFLYDWCTEDLSAKSLGDLIGQALVMLEIECGAMKDLKLSRDLSIDVRE